MFAGQSNPFIEVRRLISVQPHAQSKNFFFIFRANTAGESNNVHIGQRGFLPDCSQELCTIVLRQMPIQNDYARLFGGSHSVLLDKSNCLISILEYLELILLPVLI